MKTFILIICLFGSNILYAQHSIGYNVLADVARNNEIFGRGIIPNSSSYSNDSVGRITLDIHDTSIDKGIKREEIILVDTFGFFPHNCSVTYGNRKIEVVNALPLSIKKRSPNVFWVSGIATGRMNALAIALLNRFSNYQVVYYFSIMGKSTKIIKTTSGNF